MLMMDEKKAERIAREFHEKIKGIPGIGQPVVLLFGSAARGSMDRDSDIDILVVIEENSKRVENGISDVAFRMSIENDVLINEIVLSRGYYEGNRFRATPFFGNVQKEGIAV